MNGFVKLSTESEVKVYDQRGSDGLSQILSL